MAYQNIMANMSDEWIGQYMVGQVSALSSECRWLVWVGELLQSWDLAVIPPWYWTSGPLYSACRWAYQCTSPLRWGCQNSQVMVTEDLQYLYWFLGFFGWDADTCGWTILQLTPLPAGWWVISANPGGGHGGLWWDCGSIFSWEEAAGMHLSPQW